MVNEISCHIIASIIAHRNPDIILLCKILFNIITRVGVGMMPMPGDFELRSGGNEISYTAA